MFHSEEVFRSAARANLLHSHPKYPFYLLDPSLDSPGQRWWRKRLRRLIEAVGVETIASNVFVIEIHGYHSKRFAGDLSLPSQRYTKALVRAAIARADHIVLMRGRRPWLDLVPELASAKQLAQVRNVQNPAISPGNLPETFAKIASVLRAVNGREHR